MAFARWLAAVLMSITAAMAGAQQQWSPPRNGRACRALITAALCALLTGCITWGISNSPDWCPTPRNPAACPQLQG